MYFCLVLRKGVLQFFPYLGNGGWLRHFREVLLSETLLPLLRPADSTSLWFVAGRRRQESNHWHHHVSAKKPDPTKEKDMVRFLRASQSLATSIALCECNLGWVSRGCCDDDILQSEMHYGVWWKEKWWSVSKIFIKTWTWDMHILKYPFFNLNFINAYITNWQRITFFYNSVLIILSCATLFLSINHPFNMIRLFILSSSNTSAVILLHLHLHIIQSNKDWTISLFGSYCQVLLTCSRYWFPVLKFYIIFRSLVENW